MDPADVKPSQEPPAPDAAQPGAGKRAFEQTQRLPRAPTLRSLVKLALKCDSAEEMGKQLKRRFDRSLRRRGIEPNRDRRAEAEVERLLGQD